MSYTEPKVCLHCREPASLCPCKTSFFEMDAYLPWLRSQHDQLRAERDEARADATRLATLCAQSFPHAQMERLDRELSEARAERDEALTNWHNETASSRALASRLRAERDEAVRERDEAHAILKDASAQLVEARAQINAARDLQSCCEAVLYYADNPMTGTSLQLICDDIRRALGVES